MDTIVGREELVVPVDLDPVFLARDGRRDATIGGPHARGACPRLSNAIIQRTRPKTQGRGYSPVMMQRLNKARWRLHSWRISPASNIVKKQATTVL